MVKVKLTNRGPAGILADGKGMVNRGAAGLIAKLPPRDDKDVVAEAEPSKNGRPPRGQPDRIRCPGEVVELSSLALDPMNARLHPERNMEAIEDSLNLYGQMTPLVVVGGVVMKGNGTLQAMRNLGWTKCAVSPVQMSEVEAAGYGLADNRTAEHARWDFEVVAKIDAMMREAGQFNSMPGWSLDELEVLRAADWTPPSTSDEEFKHGEGNGQVECPACGHKWEQ